MPLASRYGITTIIRGALLVCVRETLRVVGRGYTQTGHDDDSRGADAGNTWQIADASAMRERRHRPWHRLDPPSM